MENFGESSSAPKMEKQSVVLGNQNGGTVPGSAPALYVLVKQSTRKSDQGILVSNQDDCGLAISAALSLSKVKTYLPAERTSGSITVTLDNSNMWNEFYHRHTEMILTKQGRRMFPYCRYWIRGLQSSLKYILVMDISPVDNFRYKWNGHSWEPSGKAEPHVLGRVFIHPESPSTGYYWMHQPVSFYKLKVTNNTLDQEGHIILHSMHRYLPRLHLVPADKATDVIQLNGPDVHTFTFPQTEFFAVTAYQNIQITQLKIDYNPFAKGFRDDGLSSRLQRDAKQNGSTEQEGGSLTSSPTNHKHLSEGDSLDPEQRALETSFGDTCNTGSERESLSPYHDLGFTETGICGCDGPALKQETSESPKASSCKSISHVASLLNSNGDVSVEVKEEPVDDYDYGPSVSVEGVSVKQEEEDNMTEEYLNSSDSVLDQQLKKHSEMGKTEIGSHKQPLGGQLGVARAKMLQLDSGKMPVVYLEPCAVTRNTVKISALSPDVVSPSKSEQSPLSHSVELFPTSFENSFISSPFAAVETKEIPTGKQISEGNVSQRCSLVGDVLLENNETSSKFAAANKVSSCSSNPSLAKVNSGGKKTSALKIHISCKNIIGDRNVGLLGTRKRGRPRKMKHLGVGRPPKDTGTNNYTSLGPDGIHLDVKPDLVDVDGVLFVSFASKEALDVHSVDRSDEKELKNKQIASLATCDPCADPGSQMIQLLEKELLEDLKSFKYRQVIHPSLREVGLKLNFVDPAMSIDLKYLGVQLPLSYSDDYTSWKNLRGSSSSADAGLPFVSRTGKTNDLTKIKGWREKLHSSSKPEGIIIEGSLKNRSAFCSDKLDEYLENEGKLLETSMGLSPSASISPVVYQLPTKSTSYVRTLDSVLKKQSTITTSTPYALKPLSVPSVSKKRRRKVKNRKQAVPRSKEKSLAKSVIAVVRKQKCNLSVLEEKVTRSQPSKQETNEAKALMVPATEENTQGKQITVRQQQQQPQQSSRLPGLSKTQLKLIDLEDYALWDGKPRTYITEERADLSLTTLLTAQASLKNKPIHKKMKRQTPPCNNDFCRLGCICSSLALEKRQPAHCRKPDCMFGCTCLKRKVVLVKGDTKKKKILEKSIEGMHKLHFGKKLGQPEQNIEKEKELEKLNGKDKKRKKKVEYTICVTEPEKPVKNFPLWVKVDGELDPEPVYIPTPSTVEPTKPVIPPNPEVLTSDDKPAASEVKLATGGVKPTRVYTPKPNPVIREEDKDPVYLYFESMMTCARVRIYTRKPQEKKQQPICPPSSEEHIEKEDHPELQPIKIEEDKEPGEKNCWFSCSAEDPCTSYVHHTTPDGKTKLVEIVSDCRWEEDRDEILNTLSEHIKSKMPKSLQVGNFVIDLESESKTWDEKNNPIYSSRVKISMLSCQNKSEKAQITVLETSDSRLSPCKKTENPPEKNKSLTPGMLREERKKGLPFYAGLSPAGKLLAYTCKSGLTPSSLIQVNGKNYPQAKLLLGQMGALHPASRLAAYLTGRLRPAMLDLSTISTVISKVASNTKVAASESQSAEVPTSETPKIVFLDNTNSTLTPNVHVSAQRQIAIRPLLDGVSSQLVMSAVGALQQKIPGIRTPQPLTGPQKFSIRSTPLSSGTTTFTAATPTTVTVASLPLTSPSSSQCNKAIYSPGIAITNATEKTENSIASVATSAVTVKITKSTGIATPIASIAFAKSAVTTSAPVSITSLSTISPTTMSIATVTTPTSPIGCVGSGPSGVQKSPVSNKKPGTPSPPNFPPGAEKRMGPRLLLIPVNPGSPTLPPQNMQLAQGKRMILQPIRNPGGVNLYRHPNGQIIQLVPLHQLQPTGSQSSLPPVVLRNSGSVVGIRLPTPYKPPEISACQSSPVSSVTPTTTPTSVLSVTTAFSEHTTTETTSVLPGTSTITPTSLLSSTTTIKVPSTSVTPAVVSTPPTIETAPLLAMPCTSDAPLLPISPLPTPVPPTAEGLSVVSVPSTSDAPLVLPVPPSTVPVSSPTEAPSALPRQLTTEGPSGTSALSSTDAPLLLPTTEAHSILSEPTTTERPSVLTVFPASQGPSTLPGSAATEDSSILSIPPMADVPLVLTIPSSATPILHTTETPSALSTPPTTNCTLKVITSMPVCPVSATQAAPVISPVFVPVSQTGTLTLRISPSGIKSVPIQMSSDSKIKCSNSRQPNSTNNLISLQSGSFALLQFPGKKNIPSPIVKQVAPPEIKNAFGTIKLDENITRSQFGTIESKENNLPANQPESHSEEVTCDQNGGTLERADKDVKIMLQSLRDADISSDPTYMNEDKKCEGEKVMVKRRHVKSPEYTQGKVSYSSETIPERCSQTVVLTHGMLEEQKVEQLKSSYEEQAPSDQAQIPAADTEEAEQTQLDTEKGMITEWPRESWNKHKLNMNSTEKIKPLTWETQDPVPLGRNMKEKDKSVVAERKREEPIEKSKITSIKVHDNASANKYLDNGQEFSSKRYSCSQEKDKTSRHIKDAADIPKESQTTYLTQVSKISGQVVALESKTSMGASKDVEKFAKYIEQNTLKTNHHRKDSPPVIDITMDDTEKEEKTDDSADEMVDEISGYQSEDVVNIETMDESESSGVEENVDIETVEELSEKINIARLKATAAHALLSKELHLVHDHSNKMMDKTPKPYESSNKKPKNAEEAFANYRRTHTANERRRRKEMRGLFERLKATLGLQAFPKVSKCFILKQAFEEIQGLTDQADKLKGQKNLLMRKQETLIRKVSTLSGKTQEVVLKKLEYIYAKQKAVEQKKKQHQQTEPMVISENTETAKPSVENSSSAPVKEMKPVIVSNKRTKPLILSRKGSSVTGDTSSHMTLTNASLVMTANGQVLAFKSPLVPGQFASLPSKLLQTELKSEIESTNRTTQPGIASVMIQLPSSAVPAQVKSILPTSTLPITLSSVASNTATPVVQKAQELTLENEDSFMMPRIVNVTSLATKEDTNLNLDINKNSFVTLCADSQQTEPSFQVVSQGTANLQSGEKDQAFSGKGRNATGPAQDFLERKRSFPQIVNVSSLKGSSSSFASELCIEEFSGTKKRTKQTGKGGDCQKSKNSSFQKLQVNVPRDSGLEMELQKVASVIHEPTLDANDLMDIEESDDADETLTSLLNEIAFLNQQLNEDASDIAGLPNSLSSGFSLEDMESHRESATTDASPFHFGAMGGNFKDLSVVRESTDSITPLLLHLDDDDLPEGNRNSGEVSAQPDALKLMLESEMKKPHPDLTAINRDGSRKNVVSLTKTRSVSPPILQMKTNLEVATTDMAWRPMPKLAPLGLKAANFSLDSEGQNTKVMPSLAPVTAKEMKTAEPMSGPNLDPKATLTLAPTAKKSK